MPTARLWVLFERDLLPGYAWVFPLPGGRANVGYGVLRDGRRGRELKELWTDLLERPVVREILGPGASPKNRVHAWPIPTRYDPASLADGRVLFVGDAAGVVDPMTGEGIAQAIETGMLAAAAVADLCLRRPIREHLGDRYRRALARALGADLRFAWPCNTCSPALGGPGRDPRGGDERLDPTQLRALDVRGLSAGRAPHASPLAPPVFTGPGAYPCRRDKLTAVGHRRERSGQWPRA